MDKLILYLIGLFFIIGGIDYTIGSPLKIGEKFEVGIKTMGALALGMVGIYSLAPIFAEILSKIAVPISNILHIDPSIFPASLLAVDMGGYQLAKSLAFDKDIGVFSSIIISSTLGTTISFTIPVAIGMIKKEDEEYFSKGIMIGMVTIPIGCFITGLLQKIDLKTLCINCVPIFIFSLLICLGLILIPKVLMRGFSIFGKIILGISILGMIFQGIEVIFGIKLLKELIPLSESMHIVGKIAFILGGAYPMLFVINKVLNKSLKKVGQKLGINAISAAGLLANLASNLIMFGNFEKMNAKGKVLCSAFAVSGAFVFGGQLGFISEIEPSMVGLFIICKLISGIISIFLASWLFDKSYKNITVMEEINYGS